MSPRQGDPWFLPRAFSVFSIELVLRAQRGLCICLYQRRVCHLGRGAGGSLARRYKIVLGTAVIRQGVEWVGIGQGLMVGVGEGEGQHKGGGRAPPLVVAGGVVVHGAAP